MHKFFIPALAVLALTPSTGGQANESKNLGYLTCSLGERVTTKTDTAYAQKILCVFRSESAGAEELYTGTAYLMEAPKETEDSVSLSWVVTAPVDIMHGPGGLEQTYTAKRDAAGKVGGKAETTLIGDTVATISLRPPAPMGDQPADMPENRSNVSIIDLKLRNTAA